MPKYLIIGLAIPIIIYLTMNYWSKITDLTKKRILLVIFGIFLIWTRARFKSDPSFQILLWINFNLAAAGVKN